MKIPDVCKLLKDELLDTGFEYGFFLDGKKYLPDRSKGFDEAFFNLLLTVYRVQDPADTKKMKVGTCNDAVVLMKEILDCNNVTNTIWLLHDLAKDTYHTVLTFRCEDKTVYLELTPQYNKDRYGKEQIFGADAGFIQEFEGRGYEVVDVTEEVVIGDRPDFILSRMHREQTGD